MRHVCFQGDASSRNRFRSGIDQLEKDRSRPDLRRFGRDFVLNRHCRRRIDRPGALGHEKSGDAGEREKTLTDMGCSPHFWTRIPSSQSHRQWFMSQ